MRRSVMVSMTAVCVAVLAVAGLAVPVEADEPALPQPTAYFSNGPSASDPRHGYLKADVPLGTDTTALVYTFADGAPAPAVSADTVQAMSPLGLDGVNSDQMGADSGTLMWSGYVTRNFAVYATDGAGNYSQPTYVSVAGMSDSAVDPGPNPGFSYTWSFSSGQPTMRFHIDHDPKSTTYAFLAQGSLAASSPDAGFADDTTYRLIVFGYEGAEFTPQIEESLDLSAGAPLTLTVFHYNLDFTHYTRTVYSMKVGNPTNEVVEVSGPSERKRPQVTTFHVQTAPWAYDRADYRVEVRGVGGAWKSRGTVSSTRELPAVFTVGERTHGYQVRAVLLTGGANIASAPHTTLLKRHLSLKLAEHVRPGSVHTATGVATGRLKGQAVEIKRCAAPQGGCKHYKDVKLTSDEHFSVKVTAPTDIQTKWFYVAVLPERDAWTPRAVSNRAGIGVSYA